MVKAVNRVCWGIASILDRLTGGARWDRPWDTGGHGSQRPGPGGSEVESGPFSGSLRMINLN